MGYVFNNPNPKENFVGDCAVRAISIALDIPWLEAFMDLCAQGGEKCDMPDSNDVINDYLTSKGFSSHLILKDCKTCYKLRDFCRDHPTGTFIIGTGKHMVAVINGDYYDTADSGDCIPVYYYEKEEPTE